MSAMAKRAKRETVGWREWVALPDLGIKAVKAKVDTGARTSALHAFDVKIVRRGGKRIVKFKVHPIQRNTKKTITAEAPLLEKRSIRSSTGHETLRPVILTPVTVAGQTYAIEVTLTNRDAMGFRMLLGRAAVRGRFVVDPGRSYVGGREVAKGSRGPGGQ